MFRHSLVLVLAGLGLACSADSAGSDRSVDTAALVVSTRPPITALDSLFVVLSRSVRPLDSAFRLIPATLRPDSGAARADSLVLALEAGLRTTTREVVATFDDSAFQVLTWPEGYRGYQLRRTRERAGQPPPAVDALVADSIRRFLLNHGIWSYMAEGDGYMVPSLHRLLSGASPFVTDAAREALRLEALEQVSPTGGDAAVGISWDSLGARLAATDRFLAAFPDAPARAVIQDRRVWYLRAFLTGWDNTAVFDHATKALRPDVRRSFERFLEIHDSTPSAEVLRTYLDLLARTGYHRTPEVDEFLRSRSGIPRH